MGVLEQERTDPQKIIIDARIRYGYDGQSYLDYSEICQHIMQQMQKNKFALIEEALTSLAHSLHVIFPPILGISLKISKPDILPGCSVGASLSIDFF